VKVDQFDIAGVSDVVLKRLVLELDARFPEGGPNPTTGLFRGLARSLAAALTERQTTEAYLEAELMNAGDDMGGQIPEGEDPIAHTLRELDGWEPS
jgi:hypothetical protein